MVFCQLASGERCGPRGGGGAEEAGESGVPAAASAPRCVCPWCNCCSRRQELRQRCRSTTGPSGNYLPGSPVVVKLEGHGWRL
eukprot:305098-Prymnesium_polylepis.1